MKTLAITGTILTLASAANYTNSISEASLLVIWGGALLAMARLARVRPASKPHSVVVSRATPDVRSTGAIRLQPGV